MYFVFFCMLFCLVKSKCILIWILIVFLILFFLQELEGYEILVFVDRYKYLDFFFCIFLELKIMGYVVRVIFLEIFFYYGVCIKKY